MILREIFLEKREGEVELIIKISGDRDRVAIGNFRPGIDTVSHVAHVLIDMSQILLGTSSPGTDPERKDSRQSRH
jgi:hypothetical protein